MGYCFVSLFCQNGDELEFLSNLSSSSYFFYGYHFTGSEERKTQLESLGNIKVFTTACQLKDLTTFDYILVSNQCENAFIPFVSQPSTTSRIEVFNLIKQRRVKKLL
jgi:hypothetical protein